MLFFLGSEGNLSEYKLIGTALLRHGICLLLLLKGWVICHFTVRLSKGSQDRCQNTIILSMVPPTGVPLILGNPLNPINPKGIVLGMHSPTPHSTRSTKIFGALCVFWSLRFGETQYTCMYYTRIIVLKFLSQQPRNDLENSNPPPQTLKPKT